LNIPGSTQAATLDDDRFFFIIRHEFIRRTQCLFQLAVFSTISAQVVGFMAKA
jgi:hypothetical protein